MSFPRTNIYAQIPHESGLLTVELVGRYALTLSALITAGSRGITALEMSSWALRLAHYIHVLRKDYGLDISTEHENHGGQFPGRHGRYRLHTRVRILDEVMGDAA